MDIAQIQDAHAISCLAPELSNDPYVGWHITHQRRGEEPRLYAWGQRNVRDLMKVWRAPHGIEVWLEAQTDNARALLRTLPTDADSFLSCATKLGLKLIQEELDCTATGSSLFCMVSRPTLTPAHVYPVSQLGKEDRSALERYRGSGNTAHFLRLFDEGELDLYGAYDAGEIVGYVASFHGDPCIPWLEVRPESRGCGYGRSLLSACATDLLRGEANVFYDACLDDMANLRVCLAIGFAPLRQIMYLSGRRRGR
jgi:ribosomal protein S18 acetylase RimI-like enzyme